MEKRFRELARPKGKRKAGVLRRMRLVYRRWD